MGVPVPRPPITQAQYEAGLKEGRDLYAEDIAAIQKRIRRVRAATLALLTFALLMACTIGILLLVR